MIRTDPASFGENPSVLVFHQMKKCAGTSLNACLRDFFGRAFHPALDCNDLSRIAGLSREELFDGGATAAIGGHGAWGVHDLLPDDIDVYYITLIRHPVTLALSFYNHSINRNYVYSEFSDFLHSKSLSAYSNALGGSAKTAMQRIRDTYCFAGMLENFQTTLDLINELFGLDMKQMPRKNVAQFNNVELTDDLRQAIEIKAAPDMRLYELVADCFLKTASRHKLTAVRKPPTWKPLNPHPAIPLMRDKKHGELARYMIEQGEDTSFFHQAALGLLFHAAGDNEKAQRYMEKSYAANPHRIHLYGPTLFKLDPESAKRKIETLLDELATLAGPTSDSFLNQTRQTYHQTLAQMLEAEGDRQEAEEQFRQAFLINEANESAAMAYASFLRRAAKPEKAAEVLLQLAKGGTANASQLYELSVTVYDMAGREGLARLKKEHESVFAAFARSTRLTPGPGNIFLGQAIAADAKVLILRSSPMMVFDDLLEALEELPHPVTPTLMVQQSIAGQFHDNGQILPMPDGLFDARKVERKLGDKLKESGPFDVILIPASRMPLRAYDAMVAFLKTLSPENMYFYSPDNMHLPANEKRLERIS